MRRKTGGWAFIAAFAISLLGTTPAEAKKNKNDFPWDRNVDTSHEYIEDISMYKSKINWTTGKVRSEVVIPIVSQDINIGRQLDSISAEMKDSLRQNLIKTLGYLRISDIFLLKDYYSVEKTIRYQIIANVDKAFYYPMVRRKNDYYGVVELDLFGENGMANLFYRNIDKVSVNKYSLTNVSKKMEYFDGLIIDTTSFNNFNPSIEMRIFDQDGVLLYGPETIERDALAKQGVCLYTTSLSYALNHPRSGTRIFYLMPLKVVGKMYTDIVIHNDDAARLLANPRTRNFLNQGQVIIVKYSGDD